MLRFNKILRYILHENKVGWGPMLELFPNVVQVMPGALTYLAEMHYRHHGVAGLKSTAKRNHTEKGHVEF
jgi:hypothetical protein